MGSKTVTAPVPEHQSVNLPILNFRRIQAGDAGELSLLLEACKGYGFFYLCLDGCEIMQRLPKMLSFMAEYFDQPLKTKMLDDRKSDTYGYEPVGTSKGVKNNSKDCYESLKMATNEMRSRAEALPANVKKEIELFHAFQMDCHNITMQIITRLSDQFNLIGEHRFESHHRDDVESTSTLSLFKYPKQDSPSLDGLGHNSHTDIGTLTLLFSEQWGLQVFSSEVQRWLFIAPKPLHAMVNVGDTLRFLSGNKLWSSIHRVIPIGARQEEHRYSIAYFLRAENNTKFTDPNGRSVTAKEWHDEKFDLFRDTHQNQSQVSVLFGGLESKIPVMTMLNT